MVTMRSLSEMKLDRMLSSVVLPAPVPPDTMMFSRLLTAARRKSSIGWVSDCALDQVGGAQAVGAETADRERPGRPAPAAG